MTVSKKPRGRTGQSPQAPAERIQECGGAVRLAFAKAADDLSDLQVARELLAKGDIAEALDRVIFILGHNARRREIDLGDRKLPCFVTDDAVTDGGDVSEAATERKIAEILYYEGLGPRPPRPTGAT